MASTPLGYSANRSTATKPRKTTTMKKTLSKIAILLFINFQFLVHNHAFSQNISINGTGATADPSAILDVSSPNMGLLIPRLPLTAINVAAPVVTPTISLLVYNTATASTGTNAVSPGYYYWDGAKWVRFAYNTSGSNSEAWTVLGNGGTNPTTNFIGTTDNQDLIFRSNNQQSGLINQSLGATSFGYRALNTANTGSDNSAFGNFSLFANTSGFRNSAFGYNSMIANNTGSNNSSFGAYALQANTAGSRNTAVGVSALTANTLANDNTAIGFVSLSNNTTGNQNVSIGVQSSYSNTTGQQNVALGYSSLYHNNTGSYNTALGQEALFNNNADQNVAVGYYSLRANTTGSMNVAVGASALSANITGFQNVAVGNQALNSNTSGLINTALGNAALRSNTTGFSNVGVGNAALLSNTNGTQNTAIGTSAGQFNTTGTNNAFLGFQSGYLNTIGINNTYIGTSAGYSNTIGSSNVAVGKDALFSNTTSSLNVAIGLASLFSNTTGSANVAVGSNALFTNTIGTQNVAVGFDALRANTTGNLNTAIGASALRANTTGISNVGIGRVALNSNTSGSYNVAVGESALLFNNTGGSNIGIGYAALYSNTSGGLNHAFGFNALSLNTTGSKNIANGTQALYSNLTGSNNVSIGVQSLYNNTGNNNSAIGNLAGQTNTSGNNNTFLGSNADATAGTFTNATAIGSNAKVGASNALILGGTGADLVKVGIGINSPLYDLHVLNSKNAQMGQWLQNGDATGALASSILLVGQGSNKYGYLAYHNDSYNNTTFPGLKPNMTLLYGSQDLALSAGSSLHDITFGNSVMSNVYMTIKGGGNVGIGNTNPTQALTVSNGTYTGTLWQGLATTNGVEISNDGNISIQRSGSSNYIASKPSTYTDARYFSFIVNNNEFGTISYNGVAGTNYNTTSDIRLKENIKESAKGIADVMKIGVKDYNYKVDEAKQIQTGFIAQELYEIYPQAVHKGGEDVKHNPWMIDYGKLTPLLIKGMQEQQAQIEKLKKEIEALKKK